MRRTDTASAKPVASVESAERGSASVFVLSVAVVLMLLAGLAVDGGRVLNARASLADVTEQAARAGAQEVEIEALRGGHGVSLNPARARTAAQRFVAQAPGSAGSVSTVSVSGDTVTVRATAQVKTTMLAFIGIGTVDIEVTGSASARSR